MTSKPANDFGTNIADVSEKIFVNDLVRQSKKDLRHLILQSQIEAMGLNIKLTTSRTGFGGVRLWFVCPTCNRRTSVLYKKKQNLGCRICTGIKYRKSRFKGMLEEKMLHKHS